MRAFEGLAMTLQASFGEKTVNELTLLFRHRQINLDPGFQRRSVWTALDRRKLLQSIIAGYPVPSIFLYRRDHRGRTVFDVLDGKQRLETILMFTKVGRFKRDGFEVRLDHLENEARWYDWSILRGSFREVASAIQNYKLQAVEITGDLSEIIELFVRINSTGKRLTSGEKRHARFYESRFLKEADRLVNKHARFIREQRILAPSQLDRMKGTELFSELLMSLHAGGPINKKVSLDRAIGREDINGNTLARLVRELNRTIGLIRRMFPDLKHTRFRNSAEFYSLFLLVWEMDRERFILTDRKRSRLAFRILRDLSTGVDQLRDQLRKVQPAKPAQRLYADYLLTVQGDTDSSANRERRRDLLKGLLWSLYARKDGKRGFSSEQRRILWNSDERRLCARCHKPVSWEDLTIDHVRAYTRGGRTALGNAQLMHRRCNSSKGAR